mgnify:CR=1 FL=1
MAEANYVADAYYRVRVTRPVQIGPITYLPRHETDMQGRRVARIIAEHGESAIDYANPL